MFDLANHLDERLDDRTSWTAGSCRGGGMRGTSDHGKRVTKSSKAIRNRWACPIILTVLSVGTTQAALASTPQRDFASTEEAVDAFVAALREHKEADLRTILGPDADRVIESGDRDADQKLHQTFIALFDQ